jgi:hypothetical protein
VLSEVERYFTAKDVAESNRDDALEVARAAFRELASPTAAQREVYSQTVIGLGTHYHALVDAEWGLLEAVTADPFVRWITENFKRGGKHFGLRSEAEAVLRVIPVTVADLREFASDKGWCESFDRLLEEAIAAGAISEVAAGVSWRTAEPVVAALEVLHRYVGNRVSVSQEEMDRLDELVFAVASAAVAEAALSESAGDTPEAAAVAEGQGPGGEVALDVSSWQEWAALRSAAAPLVASGDLVALQERVTAVARLALVERSTDGVEESEEAAALRDWVLEQGGGSYLGRLRELVAPIVARAARS